MTSSDREEVLGIVLGDSNFFFHSGSHVIDSVVELGRVVVDVTGIPVCDVTERVIPGDVVDVQYVDNDCSRVSVFVVEHSIRQLVTLFINK